MCVFSCTSVRLCCVLCCGNVYLCLWDVRRKTKDMCVSLCVYVCACWV